MTIDVNTTSNASTHFLAGVQLVYMGNKKYDIPSENWPYPTEHRIGDPWDRYYAEIWHDGMDWNSNFWLIESFTYDEPKIYPLVLFEEYSEREKISDYSFSQLMRAILYYRRDVLWIKSNDPRGVYNDEVWSFIKTTKERDKNNLIKCSYQHASQPNVYFWFNLNLLKEK